MRKYLIILTLLIGIIGTAYMMLNGKISDKSNISLNPDSKKFVVNQQSKTATGIFTPKKDIDVLGISLDMEKNEVEKELGKPNRVETVYCFFAYNLTVFLSDYLIVV